MQRNLWILLVLVSSAIQAQVVSLSGYVRDATTGELITGALVTDSMQATSTLTNGSGYYNLSMSSGLHGIIYTADGYQTVHLNAKVYNAIEKDIKMMPLEMGQVDSFTEQYGARFDYRSSYYGARQSAVKKYMGIGSIPDLPKYLQYLPGVQMGIDGMSSLYVRGSGSQENLTNMDGLPVYGVGRLFGFLSNYNTGLIRDFSFYRGVAPARYGGRSGAVLDVNYIDGSNRNFGGELQVNILCFDLKLDGYLDKNRKTLVAIGARRSWIDLFLQRSSGDNYVVANFHDLNFKISHRASRNMQYSAWVYNGRDNYGFVNSTSRTDSQSRTIQDKLEVNQKYQNTLAGFSAAKTFTTTMQGKFTVGMSRFAHRRLLALDRKIFTGSSTAQAKASIEDKNAITDFILNADFQKAIRNNVVLRYGLNSAFHNFTPIKETYTVEDSSNGSRKTEYGSVNNHTATEAALYLETEWGTAKGATLNVGGRAWFFAGKNKTYIRAEPRILINQPIGKKDGIKLAFGMANQGVHSLSSVTGELPRDGWVASSDVLKPLQSMQITGGYYSPLGKGIIASADFFYKTVNGVLENNGLKQDVGNEDFWKVSHEQGKTIARGLELMVNKKYGKLSGLLSYTFSIVNREFTSQLLDNSFPFRWDRRHKFASELVYDHSEKMKYTIALVTMSGNPVTIPTGVYRNAFNQAVYDYSERNNFTLPMYFRIDLGFERTINPYRFDMNSVAQYWGMHIYNVTAHTNYYSATIDILEVSPMQYQRRVLGNYLFSFLPTAYYKLKF